MSTTKFYRKIYVSSANETSKNTLAIGNTKKDDIESLVVVYCKNGWITNAKILIVFKNFKKEENIGTVFQSFYPI